MYYAHMWQITQYDVQQYTDSDSWIPPTSSIHLILISFHILCVNHKLKVFEGVSIL